MRFANIIISYEIYSIKNVALACVTREPAHDNLDVISRPAELEMRIGGVVAHMFLADTSKYRVGIDRLIGAEPDRKELCGIVSLSCPGRLNEAQDDVVCYLRPHHHCPGVCSHPIGENVSSHVINGSYRKELTSKLQVRALSGSSKAYSPGE